MIVILANIYQFRFYYYMCTLFKKYFCYNYISGDIVRQPLLKDYYIFVTETCCALG